MKPFYLLILICLGIGASAQKLPPSLIWQKTLGGTKEDKGNGIIKAIDGGFIVVGSTKSNNGDLTGHHGSTDSSDAWVVKLSATGAIEWQRNYGGTGKDEFNTVIRTSDGNYICFGTTTSSDGDVTGYHTGGGNTDWWVVKIDRYGNIIWQKALGGTSNEPAGSVREFSDGSLYLIGSTWSKDGDVGNHGIFGSNPNVWVAKMDLAGNVTWKTVYGGEGNDNGFDIAESDNGTFIVAVESAGLGTFAATGNAPFGVVAKMDPVAGLIWKDARTRAYATSVNITGPKKFVVTYDLINCYPMEPNSGLQSHQMEETSPGQFSSRGFMNFGYCLGYTGFSGIGYKPQGPNSQVKWNATDFINVATYDTLTNQQTPHGKNDGFITSYYQDGNNWTLNWKKYIGGSDEDWLVSVEPISETEFIVVGYTKSNNDDVSGNHGDFDMWVVKFGNTNVIKGSVFIDRNKNGTKESDEPAVSDMLIESKKGSQTMASNSAQGIFSNTVDTGNYVTSPINNLPYYTPVPASHNTLFAIYNITDSVSFALQPIPGKIDYRLQLFMGSLARPGFKVSYHIKYENIGTDTLTNKKISFVKDSRLTYDSADLTASSISGDTIRFNITSLLPGQSAWLSIHTTAAVPPALNYDDTLTVTALIDSTGDLTSANNYDILKQVVVGSFDPNDKLENHAGSISAGDLNSNKPLVYTIRFQNTGTDTAFNIVIRDTLDAKLDWSSLEMIGASHPYTLSVKNGNILTWTFANILLVDSNRNEPASHGYISYRIKVKPGWTIGDKIRNKASIYFDFNLPVETNTTETTISVDPPPTPVITGLQTNYCSLTLVTSGKVMNLPATGSGITVTVKIDNNTVPLGADSTFSFNVSTLSAGAHTVTVQYSNAVANRISSSNFTITEAIEPNVNVSASLTTITNLTIPVIVTAENAAGGGTGPLYTFARDRNFTIIAQAESVNNTWTLNPSILTIGDNKIYVRMKSNATCLVTSTVIDSILLVRSSVTGITDPDMPGQVINIYPNPFKDAITINGLSTSKTYTVKLFDLEGKQLVSKRVSGRSSISLTRQHQATGIYWLSIYDEKRKQLLGTVKMMKQ